jgi:hypothetical protein
MPPLKVQLTGTVKQSPLSRELLKRIFITMTCMRKYKFPSISSTTTWPITGIEFVKINE